MAVDRVVNPDANSVSNPNLQQFCEPCETGDSRSSKPWQSSVFLLGKLESKRGPTRSRYL